MRYVVLGTAGHIDHGKSALVKALTGTDPDRLKEEKERGITIDLGFAHLSYPDGLDVGIVDVPGHERLIKNMLAGAGGIDLVLLVIAADEGVMPQSREHLAICNLLNIKRGLIAITKADLAEDDWIQLVKDDVRKLVKGTFLEGSEPIEVSSKTGSNITLLMEKIREVASDVEPKPVNGLFRLPVDRVFTLKGFGTVVTGTAIGGSISVDSAIEFLPGGKETRIRGLQSHGESLKRAYAGQRVAVNLQGVEKEEIHRGDVLTLPKRIMPTSALDAKIGLLADAAIQKLRSRSLVHFHVGTSEVIGRVIMYDRSEIGPGEDAYCQLRFVDPVVVMSGDRFIIRRFSPPVTIGGGIVLDPSPRRRRRNESHDDLETFERGNLGEKISMKLQHSGIHGRTLQGLEGWINAELPDISDEVERLLDNDTLIRVDNRLLHKKVFEDFARDVVLRVRRFHEQNPLKPGIPKEDVRADFKWVDQRIFEGLLTSIDQIKTEKEIIRLKTFEISLSRDKELLKEKILDILDRHAFQPLLKDELAKELSIQSKELTELLGIMVSEGSMVRINDTIYLTARSLERMIDGLKNFFKTKAEMTVGEFRDILDTSRKFALPFLEYLDSNRITLRVGDVRKLLIK